MIQRKEGTAFISSLGKAWQGGDYLEVSPADERKKPCVEFSSAVVGQKDLGNVRKNRENGGFVRWTEIR